MNYDFVLSQCGELFINANTILVIFNLIHCHLCVYRCIVNSKL